jgi:hypothetical protein
MLLHQRLDTPPPVFIDESMDELKSTFLDQVYLNAFQCSILSPSHGNTQPVRFAYFERMDDIVDLFKWLDQNYSKEFRPAKYNNLVPFYGEKVKRLFVPLYKVYDRQTAERSNPEWESIASASIAVNNACIAINIHDPYVDNNLRLYPSVHWWSGVKVLPYITEYLYVMKILNRDQEYKSLGLLLGGFISEETRQEFINHPKHTEKISLDEFLLRP